MPLSPPTSACPVALAAVLLASGAAGCSLGGAGDQRGSAATTTATTTTTARTTTATTTAPTPLEVCSRSVAYWSDEVLSHPPDWGLDYQEMGLSDHQYRAVRDIVQRGRRMGSRPAGWARAEAQRACQRIVATAPDQSGGGWPD